MQDMDGIEIEMPCACSICGAHIKLVAAGVPTSVQEFMMVPQKKWVNVLCQRRWPDGGFLVAQFKEETNDTKLDMLKKLFKFECQQVIAKVNAATGEWQRPKQGLSRLKNCSHSNDLPSG